MLTLFVSGGLQVNNIEMSQQFKEPVITFTNALKNNRLLRLENSMLRMESFSIRSESVALRWMLAKRREEDM